MAPQVVGPNALLAPQAVGPNALLAGGQTYLSNITTSAGGCCALCSANGFSSYAVTQASRPNDCSCNPGTESSSVSDCRHDGMPRRVVLGVSTGHAGTGTLSGTARFHPHYTENGCYVADTGAPSIVWNFEASHVYLDGPELAQPGLKSWYASLKDATEPEATTASEELVRRVIVPDMIIHSRRVLAERNQGRADTYVDLGHHLNLGVLSPLIRELHHTGTQVGAIRIIRGRYDTVRSFASEGKSPCDAHANGMFTLCPRIHRVRLNPPPGAWDAFDADQRILWYVDEVEARWQHVLRDHPNIEQRTLTWCASRDFQRVWERTAGFIGGGQLRARTSCPHHTHTNHTRVLATDEELAAKDEEYRRLMRYGPDEDELIRATRQEVVCGQGGSSA